MKSLVLNLPTFGFVVATRGILGFGLGLLVANRMSRGQRRRIGLSLLAIGAASTVPAVRSVRRALDASPNKYSDPLERGKRILERRDGEDIAARGEKTADTFSTIAEKTADTFSTIADERLYQE